MSEYWVSKKQYWCKYCDIFIRDDAPSRHLHESGLKHQGNKERFIRNLYKGGEAAKREKDQAVREYQKIEEAAKAAYAKDRGLSAPGRSDGRPVAPASAAVSRPRPAGTKWSNYSTAAQLGFDDEDTKLSSYEIEQMVRGRDTKVGQWEEVKVPPPVEYGADGIPLKRKVDETEQDEDPEHPDNWKLSHPNKRVVHDPYDDDDWDPKAALSGLKLKKKDQPAAAAEAIQRPTAGASFTREGWSGKLDLKADGVKEEAGDSAEVKQESASEDAVQEQGGMKESEVKKEEGASASKPLAAVDKPDLLAPAAASVKPEPADPGQPSAAALPEPAAAGGGSMFKKRRPPPSSRKK